jgi:hypothetical protein
MNGQTYHSTRIVTTSAITKIMNENDLNEHTALFQGPGFKILFPYLLIPHVPWFPSSSLESFKETWIRQ